MLRSSALLLVITATTYGKWWLSFDVAAPHHRNSMTILKAATWSGMNGKKNTNSFSQ
ncbi:Uncharacterised protein [Mycobacterium tuberculosis]|nr:Uncharacterised protein [Mycobacterium tuberculosis]